MKKFLIGFGVVIAVLVAIGLFVPADFHVEKTVTIQATPAAVHSLVGDLKRWPEWAPWQEEDPTIVTTYGDSTTGVGASQTWTGKEGDGMLTLTKSDPKTGIAYDMAFIMEGKEAPATCAMTYNLVDGATEVTWSMHGTMKGVAPPVVDGWLKIFSPWMIGGMFDQGLNTLKEKVEAKG